MTKIWTNNPLENLNSRIKRRAKAVSIFPNRASVIRLVGMALRELHEDWITGGEVHEPKVAQIAGPSSD